MAERKPLVLINGVIQELPDGDTVPGAGGGGGGTVAHSFEVIDDTSSTTTSGAGSVTYTEHGATVNSGATSGGRGTVVVEKFAVSSSLWLESGVFGSVILKMPATTGQSLEGDGFAGICFLSISTIGTASINFNQKHVGFSIEKRSGTLVAYATNGSGTAQTKTSFTFATFETAILSWVIGDSDIKFYKNGVLIATHTTNLPSGSASYEACAGVSNRNSAESLSMALHNFTLGVALE